MSPGVSAEPNDWPEPLPGLARNAESPPQSASAAAPEPVPDAGNLPGGTPDAGPRPAPDAGATNPLDAGATHPPDAGSPPSRALDAGPMPDAGLWVSGYYPGWTRATLRPSDIDYAALSHLIDFSLHPLPDGSLEDTHGILSTSAATLSAAHGAGVRVLVCVGGANTAAGFRSATSAARLDTFVTTIVSTVTGAGYDGVDLDWEPLSTSDAPQYRALVSALHAKLAALVPRRSMTAAVDSWAYSTVAPVAGSFDQVNVMTYDMSSPGTDGVTWYNSPLSGGTQLRASGAPVNSSERSVQSYRSAGIAAAKLGIGIAFYGNLWSGGTGTSTGGVSAPRQRWTSAPTMSAIDYRAIMSTYYQPALYHFDTLAGSAWLGIDQAGAVDDRFIAYEDEASIALKLAWVKAQGLGGVIIWQLAGDWSSSAPAGQRAPLLKAVRAHR